MGLQMLREARARDESAVKAGGLESLREAAAKEDSTDEIAMDPVTVSEVAAPAAPKPEREALPANVPPRYRNALERAQAIRQRIRDQSTEEADFSKLSPLMQALMKVAEAYGCSDDEIKEMTEAAQEHEEEATETFLNMAAEIGFQPGAAKSTGSSLKM